MNVDWHRLFGLALMDFFAGSPWKVDVEKDLSVKQQYLDVVILRREPGEFIGKLPDGLDHLADHNLLTYKSHHEPLNDWSLKELSAHYVNYRKLIAPKSDELAPESVFQLFGVCTRFPKKLASQVSLKSLQTGVYEVSRGTDKIRIIVLSEIPREEHNSIWHLFSADPEKVRFGAEHHRPNTSDSYRMLCQLLDVYRIEGFPMPYTMEQFREEFDNYYIEKIPVEKRLHGLSADELVRGLSDEQRRKLIEKLVHAKNHSEVSEPGDSVDS